MKMNNSNQEYIILSDFTVKRNKGKGTHKMQSVLFSNTGTIINAIKVNVDAGKVKDPYEPSRYGVGYDGFFKKSKPYWKQAKQLWGNMLKRCYCEKDKNGYYGRVIVCKRWLCFSDFLDDLEKLPNFNEWLNSSTKYNLDKDLIYSGNKVYSQKTCMFVEESVNKADGATRGKPYSKVGRD